MPTRAIAEYISTAAIAQHRKAVGDSIARLKDSVDHCAAMQRISVRIDDLRSVLAHIDALKSDIYDTQKAALREAIGTIEFVANIQSKCDWKDCVGCHGNANTEAVGSR